MEHLGMFERNKSQKRKIWNHQALFLKGHGNGKQGLAGDGLYTSSEEVQFPFVIGIRR